MINNGLECLTVRYSKTAFRIKIIGMYPICNIKVLNNLLEPVIIIAG